MIELTDLHIEADPVLFFVSNSIENKGKASKTYTIKIVRDGHNDAMLQGLFTSRAARVLKFEATYTTQGLTLDGTLLINSINELYAEAVFTSGNGKLWEQIENKNLRDYDYSSLSHTLTKANVIASESGGDYVYDLCDRGEWVQDNLIGIGEPAAKVDLSERYPAISVLTLLELIFNQEGAGVIIEYAAGKSNFEDYYLLFTGDKDIRNSAEWLKSTLVDATATAGTSYTQTGSSGILEPFLIDVDLDFDTIAVNDGTNFDGQIYTIHETGTYRFVVPYNIVLRKPTSSTVANQTCWVAVQRNGVDVFKQTITVGTGFLGGDPTFDFSGMLDCKFTEFSASDEITAHLYFVGDITHGSGWTITVELLTGTQFYNQVTRWYGAGSMVDFSKIVPDMGVLDFLSSLFNYLNVYTFYDTNTKQLTLRLGREMQSTSYALELEQFSETLDLNKNYWLKYNTDKIPALDNDLIDNLGVEDFDIDYNFSRTFIGASMRLFMDTAPTIPVLWESTDVDPSDMRYRFTPPKWVTKSNLRVLKYLGSTDIGANYDLTFGGDTADNEDNLKVFPSFEEPDIASLHGYDFRTEPTSLTGIARLKLYDLVNQTLFKVPVYVEDFGYFWLNEATQISGEFYRVNLINAGGVVTSTTETTSQSYVMTLADEEIITLDNDFIIV